MFLGGAGHGCPLNQAVNNYLDELGVLSVSHFGVAERRLENWRRFKKH